MLVKPGERLRNTIILLVCLVVIFITMAGVSAVVVVLVNRALAAVN